MTIKEQLVGKFEEAKSQSYYPEYTEYFSEETAIDSAEQLVENISIQFAEWLQKNRWFSFINGKWNYTFEQGTSINEADYNKNYRKTTKELFETFKKQKGL